MWYMCNVVWYDGQDAYVSKFVLKADEINDVVGITEESDRKVRSYISGNGEVLKVDLLYPVDFDNIVALKSYENSHLESEIELYAAYDRFKHMWF